jgi:hypothetical protein
MSSAIMVRLHKVYGNLMVDMKASNAKLVQRAVALTMHATGADEAAGARGPGAMRLPRQSRDRRAVAQGTSRWRRRRRCWTANAGQCAGGTPARVARRLRC